MKKKLDLLLTLVLIGFVLFKSEPRVVSGVVSDVYSKDYNDGNTTYKEYFYEIFDGVDYHSIPVTESTLVSKNTPLKYKGLIIWPIEKEITLSFKVGGGTPNSVAYSSLSTNPSN